ncbi:MAG: hypothetical protein HQL27_04745 [Candidatus Omnitrophica bacterium]|nr:hypothetical protein [Candidatus Omnitrophota bacterium]
MAWIAIAVVLALAGIIFLSKFSKMQEKTREQVLEDLAKSLESKCEVAAEAQNSYRINFVFEGKNFIYEDFERASFREKIYKGFLKCRLKQDFIMNFSEKQKDGIIRTSTFTRATLDKASNNANEREILRIPKSFSAFNIYSNNVALANRIMEDKKSLKVLLNFKGVDNRGMSYMPLRFLDNFLVLEFDSSPNKHPNIKTLYRDVHSIEQQLVQLVKLIEVVERV